MSPESNDLAALRKGSAEMMILALLEGRARHGYEIAKQIESQSGSVLQMLEKRGFIAGKWVEKPGVRRRRYYSITAAGKKELAKQRASWSTFWQALCQVAGLENA
jgi:PadR family transcriptional regulator, regulatory protein PadR